MRQKLKKKTIRHIVGIVDTPLIYVTVVVYSFRYIDRVAATVYCIAPVDCSPCYLLPSPSDRVLLKRRYVRRHSAAKVCCSLIEEPAGSPVVTVTYKACPCTYTIYSGDKI